MKKFFFSFVILLFASCVNEYSSNPPRNTCRFVVVYQQSSFCSCTEVLLDTETGQKYLFRKNFYAGGLTKL